MAISINGITVAGIGKDGKNGVDGKDATINGVNALNIKATGGLTDHDKMAISINGITVAGIGKDGKNGVDGKDATINGVNALNIKATGGLTDQQSVDTYTIDGSGLVPKTTTVNGKPLSGNVSLAASDVGADSAGSAASALTDAKAYADGLTAADVGAIPTVTGSAGQFLGFTSPNVVGAVDAPSGGAGKRTCRFVVGTSTAGWTESDCDYLCDGADDQVEINAAIQALPSGGGEIVILDGTYNIKATIVMNKDNVKLSGNGNATVLRRMWDSSTEEGVITITATNGGCCVENIFVDGNKSAYSSNSSYGISLSGSNNTVTGNTCNNNSSYSISLSGSNNTVTGNTCNNNSSVGISLSGSSNNTVTGNICNNNSYGIYLSSSNSTVTGNTCTVFPCPAAAITRLLATSATTTAMVFTCPAAIARLLATPATTTTSVFTCPATIARLLATPATTTTTTVFACPAAAITRLLATPASEEMELLLITQARSIPYIYLALKMITTLFPAIISWEKTTVLAAEPEIPLSTTNTTK